MQKSESVIENETHKILWDFEIQKNHLSRPKDQSQWYFNKKTTWKLLDMAVSEKLRIKVEEIENTNIYQDLAWELKKLWNMKVMVIPVVVRVLGTVLKGLGKRLGEMKIRVRIGTIQTRV